MLSSTVLILTAVAFFTSIISGVIGMAGGVTLFAVMTFFLPLNVIIPVHGMNQLFSNTLRSYFLRRYIRWRVFFYFLVGVPFGAFIAILIVKKFAYQDFALLLIALLIAYTLFKPKKMPHIKISERQFFFLGLVSSFLGIFVGATGPFIAPFFLRDDFSKEEIVATKASVQFLVHSIKIPTFIYLSFDYLAYIDLILLMVVGAAFGTKVGVSLLGRINDQIFRWIYRVALFAALVRILYKVAMNVL